MKVLKGFDPRRSLMTVPDGLTKDRKGKLGEHSPNQGRRARPHPNRAAEYRRHDATDEKVERLLAERFVLQVPPLGAADRARTSTNLSFLSAKGGTVMSKLSIVSNHLR